MGLSSGPSGAINGTISIEVKDRHGWFRHRCLDGCVCVAKLQKYGIRRIEGIRKGLGLTNQFLINALAWLLATGVRLVILE